MAMKSIAEIELVSLTAAAYGSATQNAYFTFNDAVDYAVTLRINSVSQNANLYCGLSDSVDDPDDSTVTPAWRDLVHDTVSATQDLRMAQFRYTSLTGLQPFGKLTVRLENVDGVAVRIAPLVAKVLAEMK